MLLHAGHISVGLKHERFMQEAKRTEKAEKSEMSYALSPQASLYQRLECYGSLKLIMITNLKHRTVSYNIGMGILSKSNIR